MGNEPDGNNQSPVTFAAYMKAWQMSYLGLYWGCCGHIVNAKGQDWFDRYLAAGGPVPDVLSVNVYGLWCPEGRTCDDDVQRLDKLWDEFAKWKEGHPNRAVRTLPIVVLEYGGSNAGPTWDQAAMDWGVNMMASRRTTRPIAMAWFSSRYVDSWYGGHKFPGQWLIAADGTLTDLGRHFRELNR
jgi:hypothetical protein